MKAAGDVHEQGLSLQAHGRSSHQDDHELLAEPTQVPRGQEAEEHVRARPAAPVRVPARGGLDALRAEVGRGVSGHEPAITSDPRQVTCRRDVTYVCNVLVAKDRLDGLGVASVETRRIAIPARFDDRCSLRRVKLGFLPAVPGHRADANPLGAHPARSQRSFAHSRASRVCSRPSASHSLWRSLPRDGRRSFVGVARATRRVGRAFRTP